MGIMSMSSKVMKHVNSTNLESQKSRVPSEKLEDPISDWRDRLHVFMKEGPCKELFMSFQDCVEEAEKNEESISKCYPVLEKCMETHSDYYQPCLEAVNPTLEGLTKMLMPSTDSPNGVSDEEKEEYAKSVDEFFQGGGCKESYMAWLDCMDEAENNNQDSIIKCAGPSQMLTKCMNAHSDYYQPYFMLEKAAETHFEKEFQAFFSKPS